MWYLSPSFKRAATCEHERRMGSSAVKRFLANEDGNIAILFGFLALTLFGFIGAAVDYTRYNAVKTDVIQSMDAAGLAMARLYQTDSELSDDALKEYGRRFFYENFRSENLIDDLEIDFVITSADITPVVNGTMKTKMLRVGFFDEFDMHSTTEITKKGSGKIELALVLDVTGSMSDYAGGEKKIESLRTAVDALLEVMYGENTTDDNVKVGVVPFNAYVNPGGASSWSSTWADTAGEAYYHGARFFHVGEDGEVDMDIKVNHFNLFDSVPDVDWMGCVEARPYPLDEMDVPPGTSASSSDINDAVSVPTNLSDPSDDYEQRAADAYNDAPDVALATSALTNPKNTRWVPMFVQDGIDCDANWRGRCPYYYGNSYWTKTETFDIQGTSYSQFFWRSWFTDPDYDNYDEGDYYNRSFIDDEDYIGYYGGENTGRYAKIVEDFRNLGMNPSGLSTDHQNWKDMMEDYGVTSDTQFYDSDITSASDGSTANAEEYALRTAYVGWWDPVSMTYNYKYDLDPTIDESISDSDDDMTGPNRDCPAPILPLTDSRTDVENHMDTLFPNGNTNSANGAVWGWRVLSPGAPFTEGVDYSNGQWQKAVVIMTDGVNTTSNRDTHLGSDLTAYGYERESRMGDSMDDADEMEAEFDNKLLRICQRMKDQDILVYTIVFGLDDADTEEVFQACATLPEAPYYQQAPDGDDLEDAFGDIAQDLVKLHISK